MEGMFVEEQQGESYPFLTWEEYARECAKSVPSHRKLERSHWSTFERRWTYHKKAIDLVREHVTFTGGGSLEIGTMGVSVVKGSDTLDYSAKWDANFRPTYNHDIRVCPWPIESKRYDCVIALRVFHHLFPVQRLCFMEAQRVARNVVMVVPEQVKLFNGKRSVLENAGRVAPPTDRGISYDQFVSWNDGVPPDYYEPLPSHGSLFLWKEESLRAANSSGYRARMEGLLGKATMSIESARIRLFKR